jgi:hypothetical protein
VAVFLMVSCSACSSDRSPPAAPLDGNFLDNAPV